jgi:hypothetical protein
VSFGGPRLLTTITLAAASMAGGQSSMTLPATITAGAAFSIPTNGSGKGSFYLVGPGQAVRRDIDLGQPAAFGAGDVYAAGHYIAILTSGSSTETGELNVVPADQPVALGFLAKPSRLPVGVPNGVSGTVYVFDAYRNLITSQLPVTLELSNASSTTQDRTVATRNGLAWAEMNSAAKEGAAKFVAKVGNVSSTRIIDEVPGDPCSISITAQPSGSKIQVVTAPVRDCSGNAIPDGTIVTFTETINNMTSAVDVPIKQGIAKVDMPAYKGSKISAACGVVAGNEIRWEGGR